MNNRQLSIFIDVSSKLHLDNQPGTCAYVVVENNAVLHQKAFKYNNTTNNRMELCGLDQALSYIMNNIGRAVHVTIYTDSKYVRQGILEWVDKWKANGWRTAANKEVLNKDLWVGLHRLYHSIDNIKLEWCKGHADNKFNNIADKLCSAAYDTTVKEPEKVMEQLKLDAKQFLLEQYLPTTAQEDRELWFKCSDWASKVVAIMGQYKNS
jgi:ribonuclease HI